MKVRCIENKGKLISDESIRSEAYDYSMYLKKGNEYIVYAIGEIENSIWYCICDECYYLYPMWYPFHFFEITDNRLSRYWVFALEEVNKKKLPLFSFPEWACDEYFYTELVEGGSFDKNAIIFRKYKELMDLEFSDSSISEIAQLGDEEWLICPTCIDAWQSSSDRDALVRCPKCRNVMQNPRYQSQ